MEIYPDTYYKKYLKYKIKYNTLKSRHALNNLQTNNLQSGGANSRYDCIPTNKFVDICVDKENGKYRTKESCINDCESKYIKNEMQQAKIYHEALPFYLFIKDIINNEKITVYLKGGNVLGLKLLKMIYEKYKNDDIKFKKCFAEFLKLDLIKDWDFSGYTPDNITPEYRQKLDKIGLKYKLHQRAKTFCLYQTRRPILLEGKPLFEISILDSDGYSKLEIPLTTMKVKVNEYNLKYVFMFCVSFFEYKNTGKEFDFNIMKRMLEKINIIIYPHKNGIYDVRNDFDKGGLTDDMIKFIKTFDDFDKNLPQFLSTHIEDPYRMLYRLVEKNINKNNKIKDFLKEQLSINDQHWLFDSKWIDKMIKLFCEKLGENLVFIYKNEYTNSLNINKSIDKVQEFMEGISFNRIETDYETLGETGKKLLKLIFMPLIQEIGKENISNYDESKNKIIKFMKFLIAKNSN